MESNTPSNSRFLEEPRAVLKGELFQIEVGVYEYLYTTATHKALESFSPMEKLEEYLNQMPKQRKPGRFKYSKFLEFLKTERLIEEVDKKTTLYFEDGRSAASAHLR